MKPNTTHLLRSLLQKTAIPLLLLLFISSCSHDISISDDWHTLQLSPDGWTMKVPEGSSAEFDPSAHRNPLHCKGFTLYFKNGYNKEGHIIEVPSCTSNKRYAAIQRVIANGGYTSLYGKHTPHYTYIDTVDNNIASMTAPVGTHNGNVSISVIVCNARVSMFITGDDLSAEQVVLVKAMFKTLRYTGE